MSHPYVVMLNEEMCKCPVWPVNRWFMPDGSTTERKITPSSGARDADEFVASGAVEWAILCPQCGRVYVRGA